MGRIDYQHRMKLEADWMRSDIANSSQQHGRKHLSIGESPPDSRSDLLDDFIAWSRFQQSDQRLDFAMELDHVRLQSCLSGTDRGELG